MAEAGEDAVAIRDVGSHCEFALEPLKKLFRSVCFLDIQAQIDAPRGTCRGVIVLKTSEWCEAAVIGSFLWECEGGKFLVDKLPGVTQVH